MKCIFCHSEKTNVIDSRPFDGSVERRRQCTTCNRRFTTVEMPISADFKRKYKPVGRPVKYPHNYYTVYHAGTDEILAAGTSTECANQLNIRLDSFFKAVMKCERGESKKYYILIDKEKDVESNND